MTTSAYDNTTFVSPVFYIPKPCIKQAEISHFRKPVATGTLNPHGVSTEIKATTSLTYHGVQTSRNL